MNYMRYVPMDLVNGPGVRCTLFVSGCEHNCKGCYNQKALKVDAGHEFTKELYERIISDLKSTDHPLQGISLSGGDPMHPANVYAVTHIVRRIRKECPDKDVYLWTGYSLEEIKRDGAREDLFKLCSVVVTDKYQEEHKDLSLPYSGSTNQRVIRVRKD
ncbi:4Fe-4S single cluster domain protein [Vibrio phage 1.244.A._10N.261.54.C3]|nr:4Fe-4S single cluster domain protein [Vibrio phage 1.244.A._10N.261.54.C3]AUR98681.1 4Fe-4S single cluster domain protein [Vibrio phage 1.255.O._10N.286.45.F1]